MQLSVSVIWHFTAKEVLRLQIVTIDAMNSSFLAHFDAERANSSLRRTVPSLGKLGDPILLADGFSSYVFSVGDMILRVAKNKEATAQQVKEVRVLPLLKQGVSLQISSPEQYLEPSENFPFGAMIYKRIEGTPFDLSLAKRADLEQIARSLASFMLELHRLTPSVNAQARDDEPAVLWEATNATLRRHLGASRYEKAQAWWLSFTRYIKDERPPTGLVHGDLWGENIILDASLSDVVGVVDFELLATGDIAQDFAPQGYVSHEFTKRVAEHFERLGGQLGRDFERRVYDWSILRELRGLRYALLYPESDELGDTLEKLQRFW